MASSLHGGLPESHPVQFIAEAVSAVDLQPILDPYFRNNRRAAESYHPEMLTRLLLYPMNSVSSCPLSCELSARRATILPMAGIRRVVAVGGPHPITQRSNFRRDLFFDDEDRQTCLALLAGHAAGRHRRIPGTCLMSNPIHLIVVLARAGSLPLPMRDAQRDCSRWQKIRLHRRSHSGENRFFSCPLDPAHAAYAMRYVEFNPVRAGMAASVLGSRWSSARVHAGLAPALAWLDHRAWAESDPAPKWRELLGLGFRQSGELDRLRGATRNGRRFGGKDFVTGLEAKLERVLEPRKRGRKPKHSDQGTEADRASASGLAVSAEKR